MLPPLPIEKMDRRYDPMPFIPCQQEVREERCREIFAIQAAGLARRLAHTGLKRAVIGISGGLDSTLARLVAAETMKRMGLPAENILCITMPGFGTTDRTYQNALELVASLGAQLREIDIRPACLQHMKDIGHDPAVHDVTYENTQARERTQILMDLANKEGGLLVGTGDLSELAMGWRGRMPSFFWDFAADTAAMIRRKTPMQKETTAEKKAIPAEGLFDARKLGIPKMLILGLQHMFAMFGATVLVPLILVNQYGLPMSIQTTLLCAGLGTLLFHVLTKLKVPAFLGSSFAFLGGFQAVSELDSGIFAGMTGEEKLPYALGGVVIAGLFYLVMALIIKVVGVKRVMRFLPPVVTGPIIISIGLILAGSAVDNASSCWWLAALSLVVIIACNIWGKGMIKIIPILMGVLVPYVSLSFSGSCSLQSF